MPMLTLDVVATLDHEAGAVLDGSFGLFGRMALFNDILVPRGKASATYISH